MPRRAGDARSEGKPGLCWRSPADTRMPGSIATGTGVFSESVARAAEAMRPGVARVALDAAPRPRRREATSRSEHLAVDHNCQEKERQIEQRKLVYPPRRLRPLDAPAHANDTHQQNPT